MHKYCQIIILSRQIRQVTRQRKYHLLQLVMIWCVCADKQTSVSKPRPKGFYQLNSLTSNKRLTLSLVRFGPWCLFIKCSLFTHVQSERFCSFPASHAITCRYSLLELPQARTRSCTYCITVVINAVRVHLRLDFKQAAFPVSSSRSCIWKTLSFFMTGWHSALHTVISYSGLQKKKKT